MSKSNEDKAKRDTVSRNQINTYNTYDDPRQNGGQYTENQSEGKMEVVKKTASSIDL